MSSSRSASPEPAPGQSEGNDQEAQPNRAYQDLHGNLVKQIIEWLHEEKQKHSSFSTTKLAESLASAQSWTNNMSASPVPMAADETKDGSTKDYSELALERLEKIVAESKAHAARLSRRVSTSHRPFLHKKRSSATKRSRRTSLGAPSSDTEYVDGDAFIPSVDVVLDNSKTMGYTGGAASSGSELSRTMSSRSAKEDNWVSFKNEIIKLAHTLRLKGWRRVPLNSGADIDVRRLSGALTNAVYVVMPPRHTAETPSDTSGANSSTSQRNPRWVVCRIQGSSHLHV
jgi:choline kinase